jgi:glutathione S-transferase
LRQQALADGTLDFLLLGLSERARPEAQQSPEMRAALEVKFRMAFDALEAEASHLGQDSVFGLGEIAVAAVIGYADFRYASKAWREGRPALSAFAEQVSSRPSFIATQHVDTY